MLTSDHLATAGASHSAPLPTLCALQMSTLLCPRP